MSWGRAYQTAVGSAPQSPNTIVASPSSGNIAVGGAITLTAKFPSVVSVVGSPSLNLNTGGTASYVGGSGTDTLTFSYVVGSGDTPKASLAVVGSIPFKTVFSDFTPEQPISENGAWINNALAFWTPIQTVDTPMRACTTMGTINNGDFDDSYAQLQTGMAASAVQTIQATIWKNSVIGGGYSREFELLSRLVATNAPTTRCYESFLAYDGAYVQVVKWNGPTGNWTSLSNVTSFPAGTMPPVTGDIFKSVTVDHTITTYINKNDGKGFQQLSTVTDPDSPYSDGEVGMGFYLGGIGADQSESIAIGLTDFMSTSGTTAINDGGGNQVKTAFMITTFSGLRIRSG